MTEPDPEEIKHEIEMGAEDFLGRPLAGKLDERITVLEGRIRYINFQIARLDEQVRKSAFMPEAAAEEQRRLIEELRQATITLAEFKRQQGSQN